MSEPTELGVDRAAEEMEIVATSEAGPAAIRGGVLRTGGYGVGILLSLLSAPLLIRHLGVVDYGHYVTVTSLLTIVAAVTDAGLTNIGIREFAVRGAGDRAHLMRNLLALRILLTMAGVGAAIVFGAVVGYGRTLVVGTLLAGIGLALTTVQSTLTVPLVARLRLGAATAAELLRQVAMVAGIVLLVVAGSRLLPFFALPIAAAAAALALTVALVRTDIPIRIGLDAVHARSILRETIPVAAATAVGIVYYRVAIIVVSLIGTAHETGFYSASFRIIEALIAIPALLATSAFPILSHAARDDRGRLAYGLQRLFEVAVVGGAGLALVVAVGASPAIKVLAGHAFGPAAAVLRIQAPSLFATFLVSVWGFALLALRRSRALLVTNALGLVACLVLAVALVPAYGARGAAIATTAAEFCLAATYALALFRTTPALRPRLTVAWRTAPALVAGAAVSLAPLADGWRAALCAVTYVCGVIVFRAVPGEVLDAFRNR